MKIERSRLASEEHGKSRRDERQHKARERRFPAALPRHKWQRQRRQGQRGESNEEKTPNGHPTGGGLFVHSRSDETRQNHGRSRPPRPRPARPLPPPPARAP